MKKKVWIGLGVVTLLVIGILKNPALVLRLRSSIQNNTQSVVSETKDSANKSTSDPRANNSFIEIPNGGLKQVHTQGKIPPGYTSLKDFIERGLRDPERLEEERAIQQNGRQLVVLPGVMALAPEEGSSTAFPGTFEHLGFSVVKVDNKSSLERGLPVVYDPRVGSLGIITGNVQIKYEESARPEKWGSQYRMQLAQDFPDISLAFFTTQTKNIDALLDLVENLKRETQVESVTLDILETTASPN